MGKKYDDMRGIIRDSMGKAVKIAQIGRWWNEGLDPMPIYKVNGTFYCCDGWNGEEYKAFRVLDRFTADPDHPEPVILRPIYRFEDESREFGENDESAWEIVGFDVSVY